ncbi:hypothetical protein ACIP4X_26960 [Streptomyces sp. NPDC088817]|uniref:hypothetical protein n=1 Tax=unclassified Streptomyces TaxID=2593676 RepID=UPI0036EB72E1
MGAARSGEPAGRRSFGSRWQAVRGGLVVRPWVFFSWLVLAALVPAAQHWVPQPWSAAAYPIALIVALWLLNRSAPRN